MKVCNDRRYQRAGMTPQPHSTTPDPARYTPRLAKTPGSEVLREDNNPFCIPEEVRKATRLPQKLKPLPDARVIVGEYARARRMEIERIQRLREEALKDIEAAKKIGSSSVRHHHQSGDSDSGDDEPLTAAEIVEEKIDSKVRAKLLQRNIRNFQELGIRQRRPTIEMTGMRSGSPGKKATRSENSPQASPSAGTASPSHTDAKPTVKLPDIHKNKNPSAGASTTGKKSAPAVAKSKKIMPLAQFTTAGSPRTGGAGRRESVSFPEEFSSVLLTRAEAGKVLQATEKRRKTLESEAKATADAKKFQVTNAAAEIARRKLSRGRPDALEVSLLRSQSPARMSLSSRHSISSRGSGSSRTPTSSSHRRRGSIGHFALPVGTPSSRRSRLKQQQQKEQQKKKKPLARVRHFRYKPAEGKSEVAKEDEEEVLNYTCEWKLAPLQKKKRKVVVDAPILYDVVAGMSPDGSPRISKDATENREVASRRKSSSAFSAFEDSSSSTASPLIPSSPLLSANVAKAKVAKAKAEAVHECVAAVVEQFRQMDEIALNSVYYNDIAEYVETFDFYPFPIPEISWRIRERFSSIVTFGRYLCAMFPGAPADWLERQIRKICNPSHIKITYEQIKKDYPFSKQDVQDEEPLAALFDALYLHHMPHWPDERGYRSQEHGDVTLRKIYELYQQYSKGDLRGINFKGFQRQFRSVMKEKDLRALFDQNDVDGDGFIALPEYCAMLWPGFEHARLGQTTRPVQLSR